jgi:hypothetical protein
MLRIPRAEGGEVFCGSGACLVARLARQAVEDFNQRSRKELNEVMSDPPPRGYGATGEGRVKRDSEAG